MNYVISTITNANAFPVYMKVNGSPVSQHKKIITIKGGANVTDPKTMVTPEGVVTEVSDEDLAVLEKNKSFMKFVSGGFIKIKKHRVTEVEKEVKNDMSQKDGSAQPTEKEWTARGRKAPTVVKDADEEADDDNSGK